MKCVGEALGHRHHDVLVELNHLKVAQNLAPVVLGGANRGSENLRHLLAQQGGFCLQFPLSLHLSHCLSRHRFFDRFDALLHQRHLLKKHFVILVIELDVDF